MRKKLTGGSNGHSPKKFGCSYCGSDLCHTCGGCSNSECEEYVDLCLEDMRGLTVKERKSLIKHQGKTSSLLKSIIEEIKKSPKKTRVRKKVGLDEVLSKVPVLIEKVSSRWNIKERIEDGCN